MTGKSALEPEAVFEYYLLDGQDVARVRCDPDSGEYLEGQLLDERGDWCDCAAGDIVMDGEEITEEEADERVAELGGTLQESW